MKRLCTVCARGRSKGVAGKNIRAIAGAPLIVHTLRQARESALFDTIAVSSDSPDILRAAEQWGADVLVTRPPELASDAAAKAPAIHHCLVETESRLNMRFDILVDLDATAPLRRSDDIKGAVALLEESKAASVITGTPAHRSPYFNMVELTGEGFVRLSKPLPSPIVRRQDAPAAYDMNASIYVWWRDRFLADPRVFYPDTRLFAMPAERSLDIDSEFDFQIVEFLMTQA